MVQHENAVRNPHDLAVATANTTSQYFLGGAQRTWMTGPMANTAWPAATDNSYPTNGSPRAPSSHTAQKDKSTSVTSHLTGASPAASSSHTIHTNNSATLLSHSTSASPAVTSSHTTQADDTAPGGSRTGDATQRPVRQEGAPVQTPQSSHSDYANENIGTLLEPKRPGPKRSFDAAFVQSPETALPLDQPLQQRTAPSPFNTMLVPPAPASAPALNHGAVCYIPRLDAFVKAHGGTFPRYLAIRATTLKDACLRQDTFYLALHQIYCRATADPLFSVQLAFGDEQLQGLDVLQSILLSNSGLSPESLHFFANFPFPDLDYGSGMLGQIVAQVKAFLIRMARDWAPLINACMARGYPPFAAELRSALSVGSPVLQQVLFNAVQRHLAGTEKSLWNQKAVEMFNEDQRRTEEALNHYGYPGSVAQIEANARQLGGMYIQQRALLEGPAVPGKSPTVNTPVDSSKRFDPSPVTTSSPHNIIRTLNQGYFPVPNIRRLPNQPQFSVTHGQQQQFYNQAQSPVLSLPQQQFFNQYQPPNTNLRQRQPTQTSGQIGNHIQVAQPRRRGCPSLQNANEPLRNRASVAEFPSTNNNKQQQPTRTPGPAGGLIQAKEPDPRRHTSLQHVQQVPHSHERHSSNRGNSNNQRNVDLCNRSSITPVIPMLNKFPNYSILPAPDQLLPQATNPNPGLLALHQAHLRSPKYQKDGAQTASGSSTRLYQVPIAFALEPQFLGDRLPFFEWTFEIGKVDIASTAASLTNTDPAAEPTRNVKARSLLWRLKCVETPVAAVAVTQETWVVADTSWPSCIFVAVNDVQLEVRRKEHHKKDLALDITDHVHEGVNSIHFSIIRTKAEMGGKCGKGFAVAVEAVRIFDHAKAQDCAKEIYEATALDHLKRTLDKMVSKNAEDDDIQVVNAHLTIDVTDPFTAKIFDIPVRGKCCPHRECFDRDTFLMTRKARTTAINRDKDTVLTTSPDGWKCPICKRDARPQSLVVDGFLLRVRKDLAKMGKLDTKTIFVRQDGSWEPKVDGGSGKSLTNRESDKPDSPRGNAVGGVGERLMSEQAKSRSQSVVIELD